MVRSTGSVAPLILSGVLGLVGCSTDDGGDAIHFEVSAVSLVANPTEPAVLEVTVENRGPSRVTWGRGSSSCQLDLAVRIGLRDVQANVVRACTSDLVEQGLDPGERRTEELPWSGEVRRDGEVEALPAGTYPVRAAAGDIARSEPVAVRLVGK